MMVLPLLTVTRMCHKTTADDFQLYPFEELGSMKNCWCVLALSWCLALACTVGCSAPFVHNCIHESLAALATDPSRTIFAAASEPEVRLTKRQSATHPFVIHAHFDQTINQLSLTNQQMIRDEIVPEVVDFFRKALSVRGSVGRVLLNRQCASGGFFRPNAVPNFQCAGECVPLTCGPTTVPAEHLAACVSCNGFGTNCQTTAPSGSGITADFILYVAASGQQPCAQGSDGSQTIAFAAHCQQEATLDRPIAGFINICPTALQASLITNLKATVKHEVLHVLAFSSSLYAFWRDESGNPRTLRNPSTNLPPTTVDEVFGFQRFAWGEDTIRRATVTRDTFSGPVSQSVDILVTPAVVREARSFFGCPELQGVELENQGGSGSALSHWEQRTLETEIMTAQFTQVAVFSRFTLALLEDSGWYVPDHSLAHPFRYGQGLGCDFVQQGCLTWMRQRDQEGLSVQPFCRRLTSPFGSITGCTFDRLSRGVCTLQSLPNVVPRNFRYFAGANEGSFVQFTDFCPFVLKQTGRDPSGILTTITCSRTSFQPAFLSNTFAETFGTQSHCIEHGLAQPWTVNGQSPPLQSGGSGCYEVFCTKEGVVMSIFGVNFTCTCPGEEVVIDVTTSGQRFRGALLCPRCTDICWQNTELCPDNEPETCTRISFPDPGIGVSFFAGTATLLQWSPLMVTLGVTAAHVSALQL